ncbi:MAG TPA: cysteine--tRNA ligase [Candidatus Saccharimonadia bacterium]
MDEPNPPIKLYDTLTRSTRDLTPIKDREVSLYSCGPTVYNYYHIGNLRNAVFNDTLRRTLEAAGYQVRHTMNITDVGHLVDDEDESSLSEDKLEKGARREGKTVWEVADDYTQAFRHDMAAMNVLPPTVNPHRSKNTPDDPYARATDFIPEQIAMVQALMNKGFAYQTKQAIYFDITKLPNYGQLSGQKLADKEVAARHDVVTDPDKHHPHDFSVWFFTVGRYADHSMRWPSPWGGGVPGWHLECSAIIHTTLGDPIDIHTGGVDHIGTHHPNEMAQTEAAFDHPLANMWVHNEFILVDGAKMAKSKGNAYILKDITDKGFHPLALRLLYLQAHYRSEVNFTWESMEAAQNRLLNLYAWADLKHQEQIGPFVNIDWTQTVSNDLSTHLVIAGIDTDPYQVPSQEYLNHLDDLLGLELSKRPDITAEQKQLIKDREAARQAKDWAKADHFRAQLAAQGLAVDDTPAGPHWRRTTDGNGKPPARHSQGS